MASENPTPQKRAISVRPFRPEDRAAGHALRVMAFSAKASVPHEDDETYVADDRRVGAFDGEVLLAQAAAWPFGQWFLGRRVPMAGVAAVTTRPEVRGHGIAPQALHGLVEACIEQGDVFSALYPSLPGFYRRLGWAEAGNRITRRIRTEGLASLPQPGTDVLVRDYVRDRDRDTVAAVVDRATATGHGTLHRDAAFHDRHLEPDDDLIQHVAVRGGRITGYVGALKKPAMPEDGHMSFRLKIVDLMADDHDSWLALWRAIGGHAPVCAVTDFSSALHEPLLDLLPRTSVDVRLENLVWQARILDAPGAIAARGWPTGADVEVHLAVRDPWLPRNDGDWILRVADGAATLEPGGNGTVSLDIGTLSALYTGYLTPRDAAWQGRLTGASTDDLAALTEAFRSPAPWLDAYF